MNELPSPGPRHFVHWPTCRSRLSGSSCSTGCGPLRRGTRESGSGENNRCQGASARIRGRVAKARVAQGKTSPVALASRDARCRATDLSKRSQRYSRAVYRAPNTSFCGGRPCPDKGKAIVMSNINGESAVTPTESETTGTVGHFSHGSRETPVTSPLPWKRIGRRRREATSPTGTFPGSQTAPPYRRSRRTTTAVRCRRSRWREGS